MKLILLVVGLIVPCFGYFEIPKSDILCEDSEITNRKSYKEMEAFVEHPWLNVLANFVEASKDYELPKYLHECQKKMNESVRIRKRVREDLGHCFKDIRTMKKLFLNENFAQIFRYICSFGEQERSGKLIAKNYSGIFTLNQLSFL